MQYRQDIVTHMIITRLHLITITIVTIQSYYAAQLCGILFCVSENFHGKFGILWRHLSTELRDVGVVKYMQSSNRRRKDRPNRFITGDAILPQSATKVTKTCGSKFGGLLWRHLTPQRKTAIWVHNYSPSGEKYKYNVSYRQLECALCGDANPRQLDRQSRSG